MRTNNNILIIGAGMVGLSLAYMLQKNGAKGITILDKENVIGRHSSGRNSGVLHAGIYYSPDSLKSHVCVNGGRRLKEWIKERNLPLKECGKLVVTQEEKLDSMLDILAKRARLNGANIEIWNDQKIRESFPGARSVSKRAIWSPDTSITDPKAILKQLHKELR